MQSNWDIKVFTRNIRTGTFQMFPLTFSTMDQMKSDLENIQQRNLKIVKVTVDNPTLLSILIEEYPTLRFKFV